jgi:hypothetical protein
MNFAHENSNLTKQEREQIKMERAYQTKGLTQSSICNTPVREPASPITDNFIKLHSLLNDVMAAQLELSRRLSSVCTISPPCAERNNKVPEENCSPMIDKLRSLQAQAEEILSAQQDVLNRLQL